MKVHHLNCGTMCPPLFARRLNPAGRLVCHCLVLETNEGLALVDTGLGTADISDPKRLGALFRWLTGARLDVEETALRQLSRLGLSPADVRHIFVTHFDPDHAGGLSDFPAASVHVLASELSAVTERPTLNEKLRYRPLQLAHQPRWVLHEGGGGGEKWFGFESVRAWSAGQDEVLLVPLVGHTRGHMGVAVRNGDGGRWLLHAGDAYFSQAELAMGIKHPVPMLERYQKLMQVDGTARIHNRKRLQELAREHGGEVEVFCAHDFDNARQAVIR